MTSLTSERTLASKRNILAPKEITSNLGVTSRRRGGTEPPCGKLISEDNGIVSIKSKKQKNRNPEGKSKQKGKI